MGLLEGGRHGGEERSNKKEVAYPPEGWQGSRRSFRFGGAKKKKEKWLREELFAKGREGGVVELFLGGNNACHSGRKEGIPSKKKCGVGEKKNHAGGGKKRTDTRPCGIAIFLQGRGKKIGLLRGKTEEKRRAVG